MKSANAFASEMLMLFKGNQMSHGVHIPEKETTDGKKAPGKSLVVHEEVGVDKMQMHLHGRQGLGIVPIDHSNKVNFAVIDIDTYPVNPKKYIAILRAAGVPAICFRSKSGGLHIYVFFSDSPDASAIRPSLLVVVGMLGLPKTVEVFPKQTMLAEGKTGNWINLPYFNYKDTERYAYSSDAEPLSLEDAIMVIKGVRQPYKQFIASVQNAPFAQAPPCLQTMLLNGGAGEGERNHYLFNCAGYLKSKYKEAYEDKLHNVNKDMQDSLPYSELNKTIISSHNKSNYAYNCKSPVLSQYCDKELCSEREYGITSESVTSINFGQLTVYKEFDERYEWEVNGETLKFENAKELESQARFRTLCLQKLRLPQHRMKDDKWIEVLKTAMDNIVEVSPEYDEISEDALWVDKVEEYCRNKITHNLAEVGNGMVYSGEGKLIFKATPLIEFLYEVGRFRDYSVTGHRDRIKLILGGRYKNITRKVFKGKVVELSVPMLTEKRIFTNVLKKLNRVPKEDKSPIQYLSDHKEAF